MGNISRKKEIQIVIKISANNQHSLENNNGNLTLGAKSRQKICQVLSVQKDIFFKSPKEKSKKETGNLG